MATIEGRGGSPGDGRDEGELIEYATHITYLLIAPGHKANEISVSFVGGELVVEGPGVELRKPISCEGVPAVTTTYVNGVLCARLTKAS